MGYGDFKDLPRRTAFEKVLCDKAFNIAKNPEYDRYQRGLGLKPSGVAVTRTDKSAIKNENISNQKLAEVLHKPIIRTLKNWKVHSSLIENIWGGDLAYMQLINKFNKRICFYYVFLILSVNTHGLFL